MLTYYTITYNNYRAYIGAINETEALEQFIKMLKKKKYANERNIDQQLIRIEPAERKK